MNKGQKWKQLPTEYADPIAILTDLKSKTTFVFRVRVVYEDGDEGPYSQLSEEIQTSASLATEILEFSKKVEDTTPAKYELPMTEIAVARNEKAKTRRFEIGKPPKDYVESKTIMLVGATGTGKRTFVDGIINYVLGVTWEDPFRFTIVKLEDEEEGHIEDQALSQTEWITCYRIYPDVGSRLEYTLQIIDTPGFGDTRRGIERDQQIVDHIRQLFSDTSQKGLTDIDAVCFLIKAPDARLTAIQNYIFLSIMSLFGKDVENNICFLLTFADGIDPPVLAALKASKLPFSEYFTFNNSGIFASNVNLKTGSFSPMFWNIGLTSFRSFFLQLAKMQSKSLQLTKDVLSEQYRVEVTVKNLQQTLEVGHCMFNDLKQEKRKLENHKADVEANKDFVYEVEEVQQIKTRIEGGVANTKCKDCIFKCHSGCEYDDNEDKKRCNVMDSNGYCTVCPARCHWRKHFNDAFRYEHVTVKVKKTYAQMQEKYNEASGKLLTQRQIVAKNEEQLKELTDNIEDMMCIVKFCNERLKEIALRPNPLSMTDHIDLMIENEKQTKTDGFLKRIEVLNELRKNAEIDKSVDLFAKKANITFGKTVVAEQPKDIKSVMTRTSSWLTKHIPDFSL